MKRFLFLGFLLVGAAQAQSGSAFQHPGSPAASSLAWKAQQLEQQGQNAAAETIWHGLLESQPRNAQAIAHIGLDEARQDRYPDAIVWYRKALAIDPSIPDLRLNLGLALFKTSRFREAAIEFAAELRRHPGDQRLTILEGMAHYGAGQYQQAIPYLRTAAERDQQNLPLRLALAHSCMWTRQPQCVMAVYKEILGLNADSAEADMLAGEALDEMGDDAGALAQFRSAEKANPKEPDVHFGVGYLLWTHREYDQAITEFEAEIANDPQHGQSRAFLGDSFLHLNNFSRAQTELEQAAAVDPGFELIHLDLGIVYSSAGRNQDAVREFQKAIALDPKDSNPHWRLAKLYQSIGRRDEASTEFAMVKKMNTEADQSLFNRISGAHRAPPPPDQQSDRP